MVSGKHKRQIAIDTIVDELDIRTEADRNSDGVVTSEELKAFISKLKGDASSSSFQKSSESGEASLGTGVPDATQLRNLFVVNAVPFVGFGFMDNAVMLMAGDYIGARLGTAFGISTMAAAALGNMFSDVVGIGAGGTIEAVAKQLGLPRVAVSRRQMELKISRLAVFLGSAFGICIGCILGMLPLLFLRSDERRLQESFKKLDVDGNGVVDLQELKGLLTKTTALLGEEKVAELLRVADSVRESPDGPMTLNYDEYAALMKSLGALVNDPTGSYGLTTVESATVEDVGGGRSPQDERDLLLEFSHAIVDARKKNKA